MEKEKKEKFFLTPNEGEKKYAREIEIELNKIKSGQVDSSFEMTRAHRHNLRMAEITKRNKKIPP